MRKGNLERQAARLRELLLELSPVEVASFADRFHEYMSAAFHWDLWGAAYVIAGGCSDDGFADFRSWLISMGQATFESARSNPESLLDVAAGPGVEDIFFEEFAYVPAQIYEEQTGRELPPYAGATPASPAGAPWSEEGDDLQRRFPRLWARYRR